MRPLGEGRGERGDKVTVDARSGKITVQSKTHRANEEAQSFDFESISEKEDNQALFESIGRPLVQSVCEGYNGTLFAYGQTGAGAPCRRRCMRRMRPRRARSHRSSLARRV